MAPRQKAQAPVLGRCIFQRIPESHGTRLLCEQKRAVLVAGHGAANFGLFADDHALQTPRIPEPKGGRDGGRTHQDVGVVVAGQEAGERRAQRVQVVADLVDGALLGLGEVAAGVKGVLLEKEAHLVARGEEVVVADVVGAVGAAGGELGERVGGEVEGGEERVGFGEQRGDGGGGEGGGDDEVAVAAEGGQLGGGQTAGEVVGDCHAGRERRPGCESCEGCEGCVAG